MVKRTLKYAGIAAGCLAIGVPASALLCRTYLQHRVAENRAIRSPAGIASLERVPVGGIDQWIEVRSEDLDNPILLWVHGGPGIAFIPLAGAFQGPLEKHFTVVQWDQRGAGKTYASNGQGLQRRTMNVQRMEQDTLEVVNYLRRRFKREKIFVLGHSWGSVMGLWLAHEHPDLIYAYVGVGQLLNTKQNQAVMYQDALQEARSRHNEQAVKDLESLWPYPPSGDSFRQDSTVNTWAAELLGPPANGAAFTDVRRLLSDVVSAPEYSLADDYAFVRGIQFSLDVFLPQLTNLDLNKLGLEFRAPILFLEGRQDPFCRPSLIWKYSQAIKAPRKEFIWFDNAGHFPFFEEKQKFADQLFQRVLPLAAAR
jgi:pimeloyl-ACP methyl ester carboxylesterase